MTSESGAAAGTMALAEASPADKVGEYLVRIANAQYGIVEANAEFFIGEKPITLTVDGCSRSYWQLKTFDPSQSHDATLSNEEIAAWNAKALESNRKVIETLSKALAASSCSFREGDLASAFPEFFAFDAFWSKTYDEAGFLTDEEYAEVSKGQPALIDKAEFLRRMSCLGGFRISYPALTPQVCMVDRFESQSKNANSL